MRMNGPRRLIQHLEEQQYHPRSDAHSNAICLGILHDLLESCAPLAERARRGELVAWLNYTVLVRHESWNIDLAIGEPAGAPTPPEPGSIIKMEPPTLVQIAVEAKSVMTEHGKARRNRLRDFAAFHAHAHIYNKKVVAAGVVVINAADHYWSPTRAPEDITRHRNVDTLVARTADVFRSIPLRNSADDPAGIEALCVIVVEHDNLRKHPNLPQDAPQPQPSRLVTRSPGPSVGDPLHYSAFIRRICSAFRERWT